jgi:hypothetical protein
MADVTQMTVASVPSCPETGLGTSRGPPAGPHEQPRRRLQLAGQALGQPGPSLEHVIQTRV